MLSSGKCYCWLKYWELQRIAAQKADEKILYNDYLPNNLIIAEMELCPFQSHSPPILSFPQLYSYCLTWFLICESFLLSHLITPALSPQFVACCSEKKSFICRVLLIVFNFIMICLSYNFFMHQNNYNIQSEQLYLWASLPQHCLLINIALNSDNIFLHIVLF